MENKRADSSEIKDVLKELWVKVLKKRKLNFQSFLAEGGDSLKVAELFSLIELKFDIQMNLGEFIKLDQFNEMLNYIESIKIRKIYKFVVPLKIVESNENPIFFIHAASGRAMAYRDISVNMIKNRSLYGIEFNWFMSDWKYPFSTKKIIDDYIEEIIKIQPSGPYFFVGFSLGGLIALEISEILSKRNENIGLCCLIDSSIHKGFNRINYKKVIINYNEMSRLKNLNKYKYYFNRINNSLMLRIPNVFLEILLKFNTLNKIKSSQNILKKAELTWLTIHSFNLNIKDYYDFDIQYLNALKSKVKKKYDFLENKTKSITVFDFDCRHNDFTDSFSKQTAETIENYLLR